MRKIILSIIAMCFMISMLNAQSNSLTGIKVIPLPDDKLRIDFQFAHPLSKQPSSFNTKKPPRIVLDFPNINSMLTATSSSSEVKLSSLASYKVLSIGTRTRAILNLEHVVNYSETLSGTVYSIVLSGQSSEIFEPVKNIFVTHQPIKAPFTINHFDFRGIDKQGGRAIVDVSSISIPTDVVQTGNVLSIKFLNSKLASNMMKRYDVSDFHSPVKMVSLEQHGNEVLMKLESKNGFDHFVYQINKQFMVDVVPLSAEEVQQAKLKKKVFTGKRLSLNFQNISIRAVLQLLADFTSTNIVVSDKVKGDITLRLNDVPWDQALDIILTTQGLDKRQNANVMLIDTKSSLDAMEAQQLKSQQTIQKLEPVRSELLQINYAKAADIAILVKDKQNSLLSDKGKISVDLRTNTLWIQDSATKIEEVRNLIQQLDIPVKQVLIEARIVEVSKDFTQDLGIRWGVSRPTTLSGTLAGANQFAQGTAPADISSYTQRLNLDLAAAPANALIPASVGVALARLGDNILLDLELSALESEGRAELISSPRLITTNQQPAIIDSGQEIPYQESTSSGATAVSFKKAVLSLRVTPQITPDNKILMDLKINQDTASTTQIFNGVPSILTKEIQTNVLVSNGQTIVLGGIYQQDKSRTINRIPFLGQLPVVGGLFRNTQISLTNDELLIFITPKIITNSLAITTVEGREPNKAALLDKFGKPVVFDEK